jgi:dTDP-4-amino-4,6-dideoxygalactose transaminase
MKVPALDMLAQLRQVGPAIKAAVGDVIDSGQFILGKPVADLEDRLAEYVGARYAVGVSSGTDALLVGLMALGVSRGDLVVTTPYSFFATAGAVARLGATPVFVDIDRDSYNMDAAALAAWFSCNENRAERVKAIIPVHLFGQCADMAAIQRIAHERGVAVLEDAAQAIGAFGSAGSAGSIGELGMFSFFPTKNLGGIGDGGLVVTSDEALVDRLRALRVHGAEPKYHHHLVGGNFRLDAIQAAALLVKLDFLESWHRARRERAAYYDDGFAGSRVKVPAVVGAREGHVYNQYVIAVPEGRDGLQAHLESAGISTAIYYPIPLHLQECFAHLGYRPGDLPSAEYAAAHTLALPLYPELSPELQDYVIDKTRAIVD